MEENLQEPSDGLNCVLFFWPVANPKSPPTHTHSFTVQTSHSTSIAYCSFCILLSVSYLPTRLLVLAPGYQLLPQVHWFILLPFLKSLDGLRQLLWPVL